MQTNCIWLKLEKKKANQVNLNGNWILIKTFFVVVATAIGH